MTRAPRRFTVTRPRWLAAAAAASLVLLLGAAAAGLRLVPLDAHRDDPAARSVPHIVFAEFGRTADRIYLAPADDPARRTLVDTIEHAEGWGINPGVIANRLVAYTVLPAG